MQNTSELKPTELIEALGYCLDAVQPAIVWGNPGIGKSDIVRQIAKTRKVQLQDVRAVLLDAVDLRGLPTVSDNRVKWAIPEFLPKDGQGILFLDELNRAVPLVQNACFQLILDRKLGEYVLPDGWRILAACNPDGGGVTKMSQALCNRFVHLYARADVDDWCKWAIGAGIEPVVIAFVRFRPNLLCDYSRDAKTYPTPRTWEFVSRLVAKSQPSTVQHSLFAGAVGDGAAVEFSGFLRLWQSLPSIDALLLNPMSANVPTDAGTLYAISAALGRRMTSTNISQIVQYLDRMPQEYAVLCIKDATARDASIQHTKAFTNWIVTHTDVTF